MNRRIISGLMVACLSSASTCAASHEDSVVRVFATLRVPNPVRPWVKQNPVEVMGTGVVIDGKRILTNAHVVSYATEVKVQGRQGGDRFDAKVATIGPAIDLATLTMEDETFFEKRPPIRAQPSGPAPIRPSLFWGFPSAATTWLSRVALYRGSTSQRLEVSPRACAFRSMPRSPRAIAAALPWLTARWSA